jgi:signal transduction histidine kinase/CheY-like chemotaxis protein
VGSLSVVDGEGVIRHSTIPAIVGQSRRDDYVYQRLSADPAEVLVASKPFRILNPPYRLVIPLGRRITRPDGGFGGAVVASFVPEDLRGFFKQVDVGPGGTVWVFHPDGVVLFRAPAADNPLGESALGNPIFEAARSLTSAGTLRGPLRAGGPAMLSAYQPLRDPPLLVAVSLSEDDVLADWRREVVLSAGLMILLAAGTALVLALFYREMNARAVAEAALVRSQRLEAIGQLTGGVAHDFNNLLTVILGNLALLRRSGDGTSGGPDPRRLAEIEQAAERASQLTRQLLSVARRQPLQPQVVDLNELVGSLQPMLARVLGEDVTQRVKLAGTACLASLDLAQAESALLNLCLNARDAMPRGGLLAIETSPVTLDGSYAQANPEVAPGDYVMVSVSDTGTGIRPEHLARVFEPFFTTKEPGKGTGLGLSTVQGFVKQSGGHVKVYSEVGKGTSVKLYFPQAAGAAETAPPRPPAEPERGEGQTILLVEDEPSLREMAVEMLEELGYRVVAVGDGPAALDRARELERIDLLLTDVVLPQGLTGRQVAEELARQRPRLPVLFVSGYAEEVIQHRGQLDAGLRFLGKPYSIEQLAQAVRQAMEGD